MAVALVVALALLAVAPASASARLVVASTTDPARDVSQRADGSYVGGDVVAMDVVYDDSNGEVDVRFALNQAPVAGEYFYATFRLGQSMTGSGCVTNSVQYDIEFFANWGFDYYTGVFAWSYSSISAVGVLPNQGTGSATGTTLRAIAGGAVYRGRNYVCVGDVELRSSGYQYYNTLPDQVADFAFGGATPVTPEPPVPGVIDVASPLVLDKGAYRPGEVMTGTAVWRNPGGSPVTARHLVLSIRPAGVPGNEGYVGDFSPRIDDRTVSPGETIAHTSQFQIPVVVTPGNWILWASWMDTNNVWHGAATLPFTITGSEQQTPPPPSQSPPGNPSTNTPSGGGGGGDKSAPLVVATVERAPLRRALRRGLVVETQLSQAGRVTITALLGPRQAALLGLRRTIGAGSASLGEDATKNVRVRFSDRARRVLSRLSKVKITLKIQATGESGKQRVTTRAVTLRR